MLPSLAQIACSAAAFQRAAHQHDDDPRTGPLQLEIIAVLHAHPAGLATAELEALTGCSRQLLNGCLRGICRRERIERIKGQRQATHRNQIKNVWVYRIKPTEEVTP